MVRSTFTVFGGIRQPEARDNWIRVGVLALAMAKIIKIQLCRLCIRYRDEKRFDNPLHLVHPVDNTRMLFDVHGEAVCPICRSRWRRERNRATLVE